MVVHYIHYAANQHPRECINTHVVYQLFRIDGDGFINDRRHSTEIRKFG